jgi:hypothetical protein
VAESVGTTEATTEVPTEVVVALTEVIIAPIGETEQEGPTREALTTILGTSSHIEGRTGAITQDKVVMMATNNNLETSLKSIKTIEGKISLIRKSSRRTTPMKSLVTTPSRSRVTQRAQIKSKTTTTTKETRNGMKYTMKTLMKITPKKKRRKNN